MSAASLWEIEIKRALGRLRAPPDLLAALAADDFQVLPIDGAHAVAAGRLPPHHRDPFDRMLVAQAQLDGRVLVSGDPELEAYQVDRLTP